MLDEAEPDEPAEPDDDEPVDDEELGDEDDPADPLGSAATTNPLRPDNANTATKEILRFIITSLVKLAPLFANAMPENSVAFWAFAGCECCHPATLSA